jgi:hypothetical protein
VDYRLGFGFHALRLEMSMVNVTKLTNGQLSQLTPNQLNFIVTLLGSVQIQLMAQSQVQNLSNQQIGQLSNAEIGQLSALQIVVLSNAQLLNLSPPQLQFILATAMGVQFLQGNMSSVQKNSINGVYTLQTGQVVSYLPGDDGDLKHGRLVDFFTLKSNNVFGNTFRFTDENGAQLYINQYLIDHATGLGWHTALHTSATWANAMGEILVLPVGANVYNDFKLPNVSELLAIANWAQVCLNYPPFNLNPIVAAQVWTSTTNYTSTTSAIRVSYQTFPGASSTPKAASQPYLMCRKHF